MSRYAAFLECQPQNTDMSAITKLNYDRKWSEFSVADPGFPVGGRAPIQGRELPMQVLSGENVCENERIRSLKRGRALGTPPRSANGSDQHMGNEEIIAQ